MKPMLPLLAVFLLAGAEARADKFYVSDEQQNVLHVLDGEQMKILGRIPVGNRPRGIGFAPGGELYVAIGRDNRVDVVDPKRDVPARSLVSGSDPECFALSPDGKTLYAANEDIGEVSFIDIAANKIVQRVRIGEEPEAIMATRDGKWVLSSSEVDHSIYFIDTKTARVAAKVAVGTRPRNVVQTPDGAHAWASAEGNGTITVIDLAARKAVHTIDLRGTLPADAIVHGEGIVFTRDGQRAFVSMGRGNRVTEVDPTTYAVVRHFPVGERTWQLALSSDEKRLYVANGISGSVTVIDILKNAPVGDIAVGGRPWGVAVAP